MASRNELLTLVREDVKRIAQINQLELVMGTLPDEWFLERLTLEAEIANTRLTLFQTRNIEGDDI